ncbi:MAG: hypothetical protein ABSG21_05250, partial [Spirochaetia bacterium]
MGTSDQDTDSSQPPVEQPREVELTNDTLLNGENGDQQPLRSGQNRGDGQVFRGKRRIARRKIRVELIKEPAMGSDERGELPAEEGAAETSSAPIAPLPPGSLPVTGAAYAAAAAPASGGPVGTNGDGATKDKLLTQNDNRLHINDL